jgi:acyl carrier protein
VRLVALLEPSDDALEIRALRDALGQRLPAYMVPAQFVLVDRLPRTQSGKIDRRALQDAAGRPLDPTERFAAPRSASETAIVAIWQRVLRIPWVGVDDDFFELGGHSQAAMRIVTSIQEAFGIELSLETFFNAQTVRALALEVDRALQVRDHVDTLP